MLYLITLIKYLIFTFILSGIIIYLFPYRASVVISLILILSSFSSAKQEIKEKKEGNNQEK